MISAEGLVKRFDNFTAVDKVTLTVAQGEVLALLGPNGAGKTTTVRMLAGILRPSEGRAVVAGFDTCQDPIAVRRQVGLLTEQPGLYLRMRGREYLDFFGSVYGLDPQTRAQRGQQLLEQLAMPEAWERRIGTFSKGMRPPVLLLDEPTSAMDPHSAKLVRDAILSLRSAQRAILVCSHNLVEAEILADRIAIIRRGQIVALGTAAELKQRLLGAPVMELRLKDSNDGALPIVSRFARPVEWGAGWLRYETADPETVNPLLLSALTENGLPVVTLSEMPRSLEAVYLQVVEEGR